MQCGDPLAEKPYDLYFDWSDDRIYCSELIWKMYDRALGVQIGALQALKDFDLSNSVVQQKMHERYGNRVPMNEPVISPAAMYAANNLMTVLTQ